MAETVLQGYLFSPAVEWEELGEKEIKRFNFAAAVERLEDAKELDPYLANTDFLLNIARECIAAGLDAGSDVAALLDYWRKLQDEQRTAGGSSKRLSYLLALLAGRLLQIFPFDSRGEATAGREFFHMAACLIHLKRFGEALKWLVPLADAKQWALPARYWGYLGDAFMAENNTRQANHAYLRMLAAEPSAVDWATFQGTHLQQVFQRLAAEHPVEYAYALWPYHAWTANAIEIPPENVYLPELLTTTLQRHPHSEARDENEKLRLFTLMVFAEQSQQSAPVDADRRERMQALHAPLFADYMQRVASKAIPPA